MRCGVAAVAASVAQGCEVIMNAGSGTLAVVVAEGARRGRTGPATSRSQPRRHAGNEDEVVDRSARAIADGPGVGAAGAGHSVHARRQTDGTVLDTTGCAASGSVDAARRLRDGAAGDDRRASSASRCGRPASRSPTRATSTRRRSPARSRPARTARATRCRASRPRCARAASSTAAARSSRSTRRSPSCLRAAQVSVGMLGVMTSVDARGRARPTV